MLSKNNIAAALVFAGCVAFPVAYLLSDRQHPYEYLIGEIIPPDPGMGTQISVHWNVRVNRYCPGWVQRDITDQRGYVWRNVGTPVREIPISKKGEERDIVNTLQLPRGLGPGPATYQAHVTYKCNILQHWFWPIRVDTPPLHFIIQ